MRRGDDVFFFTLIDFLLQVFFFGLLLYVVGQAAAAKPLSQKDEQARQKLLKETKVSSLVELTDLLSKMVPLEQLPGAAEFFGKNGGYQQVKDAVDATQAAGGPRQVRSFQGTLKDKEREIEGLKGEMKAWGTPSCIYETVADKVRPKSVAGVRVYDDRVELENPSPELEHVLRGLGLEFAAVRSLNHTAFRQTFAPLAAQKPNCRYFLEVRARPTLLSSMNVVWGAFRTQ